MLEDGIAEGSRSSVIIKVDPLNVDIGLIPFYRIRIDK